MDKIYFNLTKIMNGWILNYSPSFHDKSTMTPTPQEEYFKTFVEAYGFIVSHVEVVKKFDSGTLRHLFKKDAEFIVDSKGDLEYSKPWINPVEGEDAYIINLPDGRQIKIDGILENIEQIK